MNISKWRLDLLEERSKQLTEAENNPWPKDFVDEILTLLDRIEIDEDHTLASQRFDIGRKYGFTIAYGELISGEKH